ncbi:MAG: NAD(P)-binding domain-containing protein [bacterium]
MSSFFSRLGDGVMAILRSGAGPAPRPVVDENLESNVPGMFIAGDLAGAPVIKLAMEQGFQVINHIASLPDGKGSDPDCYDVLICGAGPAGINAAFQAKEKGLSYLLLEKSKVANTIEDFPEGKWIYAEPDSVAPKGKLWLEGSTKEELLTCWHKLIDNHEIEIKVGEEVTGVAKEGETFRITTRQGEYQARRVLLGIGQRGNPRKLKVKGEEQEQVYHRLYSPRHYRNENILVVGGGNSAIEAALTLAEENKVTLSYRKDSFFRIFKDNERKLKEAQAAGKLEVLFNSNVREFGEKSGKLAVGQKEEREIPYDHAFVLVGAEMPVKFLKNAGIKMEGEWDKGRWIFLSWWSLLVYTIYGIKFGFWPFTLLPSSSYYLSGRSPSFWYTVLYTVAVTLFGIGAMKRWGIKKKDSYQIKRYTSLIFFQWTFFFIIPEFIIYAVDKVSYWRSYGYIYAWPLFYPTFFYKPAFGYIVWGLILSFIIIPLAVRWQGKRYCSWVCGCGGLAETLGDRWRHFAPKGETSEKWEKMGNWIIGAVFLSTFLYLLKDGVSALSGIGQNAHDIYKVVVDAWLVGIIPVALYPFLGGKIWCRYWCPLAKLMEHLSSWYGKLKISSNEKCIACGECSRYCLVGIDVMSHALKQDEFSNKNSSCIGCGICVTACPMDCLKFGDQPESKEQGTIKNDA